MFRRKERRMRDKLLQPDSLKARGERSQAQRRGTLLTVVLAIALPVAAAGQPVATLERLTFDEAIRRALANNPGVAEAAQAILQAEVLLQQARTIYRPTLDGLVTTTFLDSARGFDGLVTQPRTQTFLGASLSYPVLAAADWARNAQAEDQIRVAKRSVEETRRQIAIATGQAYLEVIAQQHQVEVNSVARENALAHLEYANARLDAGAGSRLNQLRAAQQLSTDDVLLERSRLGCSERRRRSGFWSRRTRRSTRPPSLRSSSCLRRPIKAGCRNGRTSS
jgi:outer membrane protein TolC